MYNGIGVRVGYACINLSFKENFKRYRLSSIEKREEDKIREVICHNIRLLKSIIEYNIKHNIYVYRVTSDLIPFCTHPYIERLYQEDILGDIEMMNCFNEICNYREIYDLRLSIHPSQFNVLSSDRKEVVERSISEINKQTEWIKRLRGRNVVIHIGGSYGDKEKACLRFRDNLKYIDKSLISVENDDKTYTVEEVVNLCSKEGVKWVYDYHHDRCNPSECENVIALMREYPPDKYHLSSGSPHEHSRPHAEYISKKDYIGFLSRLEEIQVKQADVVFEAKKKNKAIFHLLSPIRNGYWELDKEY